MKIEHAGTLDDFFVSGGDSLAVAQLLERVRDEFDVEVSIAAFLEEPTIAGLARSGGRPPRRAALTTSPARRTFGMIRAMKRIILLATLVTVGALSLGVAAFQQPPAAANAPKVVEVQKLRDNLFMLTGTAAAATRPSSSAPTASPSSTRRTPDGASRSSTRSKS